MVSNRQRNLFGCFRSSFQFEFDDQLFILRDEEKPLSSAKRVDQVIM